MISRLRVTCLAPLLALATQALSAQTAPVGLLVVAHGADSLWNAKVRESVGHVKWAHGPVQIAFLMGREAATASWDAAAEQLQRAGIGSVVVVPFMVSSWGSHVRQIEHYAGKRVDLPPELASMVGGGHDHHAMARFTVPTVVTRALDDAPELGEALIGRWSELSPADKARPLMLIAHGPNDHDDVRHWESNILTTAAALRRAVAPRSVRVGLMRDDAPAPVRAAAIAAMRDTIVALSQAANDSVTIIPVLISTGSVNRVTIPRDIGALPVRYTPFGLAPHPALGRWIQRVADDARRTLASTAVNASRTSDTAPNPRR